MERNRAGVFAACAGLVIAMSSGSACGQAHETVVISDPASADALRVANHYAQARGLPASSFAWFYPAGNNFQQTVDSRHAAFFGHLANQRIGRSIDYVVLGPLDRYRMNAGGLVTDPCSPVNRFSIPGSYTLAPFADSVLTSGYPSVQRQGFFSTLSEPIAFDANETYTNGSPGGTSTEGDLYIAASLGYTGERGIDADTIVEMIDRSVAADGQQPGLFPTFIFIETDDPARSGPRDSAFGLAVNRITSAGLPAAEISPGPLPPSGVQALGVMTGAPNLDFASTDFTLENGAFADHLTSWAADFGRPQQTKCSAWIERGAVGTFGTIEEPCAYSQKFPSPYVHSNYAQGVTLGEAVLRSLAAVPFQGYFMGDPLCRPYATGPDVTVTGVPTGVWQGAFGVTVNATPTRAGTGLGQAQVLVNGVVVAEGSPGDSLLIPTAHLDDGWHEIRAVVVDDSPQEVIGEWVGSFTLRNTGKTLTVSPNPLAGDRDTEFAFPASWTGDFIEEIRIVHLGRVVASGDGTSLLRVRGELLGAGPARVWAEVDFEDGTSARSEAVVLDIADTFSGAGSSAPQALSFTKRVAPGEVFVVETPATRETPVGDATFGVSSGPAQASFLAADGPARIYRADASASGSDTLVFTATDANGSSSGTVTIEYRPVPVPCLADVNGDGVATPGDFNAWVLAFNSGAPAADQNGDGVVSPGDFNAWILNYNAGCQF
ncbi:MAG: TIGR03790 family protein [Planctomycetota bacterium]